MLTLAQAAAMTGMNRSSILRAIKRGALTGSKDHNDVWHIDGAELARVFPVTPANAQPTPLHTHPDALAAYKLVLAEERIAELKGRLEEMRQERDRARAGEDAWKVQCEAVTRKIALPAPHDAQTAQQPAQPDTQPSRFRRAWGWMRATGCLAGAGLLLALSTVPAGAQQQQPQQPPPGCFTVEMSHSTQGNPQGSILLDRCTGKTWLLLCIRNDTAGCAFQWAPIPNATEPAGGP